MLKDILQTDRELLPVIRDYGCLFLCFAYSSPVLFEGKSGCRALNKLWQEAVDRGYISGDINGDGDFDDRGEAEILDHNKVASLFDLDVTYDNRHRKSWEDVEEDVEIVFGRYFHVYGHFVVLDRNKRVIFDSLGDSNTVRYGRLESMRWYYRKGRR